MMARGKAFAIKQARAITDDWLPGFSCPAV